MNSHLRLWSGGVVEKGQRRFTFKCPKASRILYGNDFAFRVVWDIHCFSAFERYDNFTGTENIGNPNWTCFFSAWPSAFCQIILWKVPSQNRNPPHKCGCDFYVTYNRRMNRISSSGTRIKLGFQKCFVADSWVNHDESRKINSFMIVIGTFPLKLAFWTLSRTLLRLFIKLLNYLAIPLSNWSR